MNEIITASDKQKMIISDVPNAIAGDLELPKYSAIGETEIVEMQKKISKRETETEKDPTTKKIVKEFSPGVVTHFDSKYDRLIHKIYPARRFSMMFKDGDGIIRTFRATKKVFAVIKNELEQIGSTMVKIGDATYEFTKYSYQGMRESKPYEVIQDLPIKDSEKKRRKKNIQKFRQMIEDRKNEDGKEERGFESPHKIIARVTKKR